MTNPHHTVIYTGVTSGLMKRIAQHKEKMTRGFTKRYNIEKLVYSEVFDNPINAIEREKQIKAGSRAKKVKLIESNNACWKDLFEDL